VRAVRREEPRAPPRTRRRPGHRVGLDRAARPRERERRRDVGDLLDLQETPVRRRRRRRRGRR
jgi:hypothetical protein